MTTTASVEAQLSSAVERAHARVAVVASSVAILLSSASCAMAATSERAVLEKLEVLQQEQQRQQREIDELVLELRRSAQPAASTSRPKSAPAPRVAPQSPATSAEAMPLDDSEINSTRLIVGLGLTLGGTVGGIVALENSSVLPAVKAANAASRGSRSSDGEYESTEEQDGARDVSTSTEAKDNGDEGLADSENVDAVVAGLRTARKVIGSKVGSSSAASES